MSNEQEIIVTGVHGFVGKHLATHLKEQGYLVHGIGRESNVNSDVAEQLNIYSQCDLLDQTTTSELPLASASAIVHLAGLASVADSFKYPERYKTDNSIMTDNLLSAAANQGFKGRVIVVSTGALYDASQPMPLNEESATIETSPYSIGKLAAEETAKKHRDQGLDVIIARPFNHIGPSQGVGFLLPDIYNQILTKKHENFATISVGNLQTRRDYTDVRDIVAAYTLLATAPLLHHGIYNIASGNSYSGEQILNELSAAMHTKVATEVDVAKVRPTDAMEIIGDASRIRDELQWYPLIPLSQTIIDFIATQSKSTSA